MGRETAAETGQAEEVEELEMEETEETEAIPDNKEEIEETKETKRTTARMEEVQRQLPKNLLPKLGVLYQESYLKEDDLQNQKISTSCSKVTLNSSQMAAPHRKVIITITPVKMETVMGEKINKSRHQMVQEETTMATKETIVHPIIKDQSQLAMEDQIGIRTIVIKITEDPQTTENSRTGITTLVRKRKGDHLIINHLNVRI